MHKISSPILAIHGSASASKQWASFAKDLSGVATVSAPDMPGYGDLRDSPQDRRTFFTDVLADLGEPAHLVAHSFGGTIAVFLAQSFPQHVRSLTLYDPIVPSAQWSPDLLPPDLAALGRAVRGSSPEAAMDHFLAYWDSPNAWSRLSSAQQRTLSDQSAAILRDLHEVTSGYWSPPRVGFDGPCSLICGGRSPSAIAAMATDLQQRFSRVRVLNLDHLGHFAPLTQADEVNADFRRCLNWAEQLPHTGSDAA